MRAWLYKIATNACLNVIERRPRRSLPVGRDGAAKIDEAIPPALREPVWLEPFPDDMPAGEDANPEAIRVNHESVTLAFMVALHRLPARQRAVLILSDVLEFSAKEVADLLDVTVSAAKSALFRARQTLTETHSPTALMLRSMRRCCNAMSMPGSAPMSKDWWRCSKPMLRSVCRRSRLGIKAARRSVGSSAARCLLARRTDDGSCCPRAPTAAHAFGLYKFDDAESVFKAYGIQVVTFAGSQVADITTCINPALFGSFKLPVAS